MGGNIQTPVPENRINLPKLHDMAAKWYKFLHKMQFLFSVLDPEWRKKTVAAARKGLRSF